MSVLSICACQWSLLGSSVREADSRKCFPMKIQIIVFQGKRGYYEGSVISC